MSPCPHCGRDNSDEVIVKSGNNLINLNDDELLDNNNSSNVNSNKNWLCLCFSCCDRNKKTSELEIKENNSFVGRYERRRTIQFQLDVNNLEKRILNKPRNSILKLIDNKKASGEVRYGLLQPANRSPLKILLVIGRLDAVGETLIKAAEKSYYEISQCETYDKALDEFQNKYHDLVIIDTRNCKFLDCETLCRSIRNTKGSSHTAVVAIVKRSAFERDDITIPSLLDAGYNRCIIETTNVISWSNELIQLKHSDIRPLSQYSTTQALYATLDKCKDVIVITDTSYRIQYYNSSGEAYLGFKHEEILGKNFQDTIAHDLVQVNTLTSFLKRGREYYGGFTLKRKANDVLHVICKAVPIYCAGRNPTHYVIVFDINADPIGQLCDRGRGSVPSIGRASVELRSISSDYMRRSSYAKLSSMPLEAPITKVIGLIAQVQDMVGNNTSVNPLLDKVIEVLRCTELYSPTVKDEHRFKTDDAITSDLVTALLSQNSASTHQVSSRRSSNDSSQLRITRSSVKLRVPAKLKEILDNSLSWEFDIFQLEDVTNKRPLTHLGMNLFIHFDVPATLACDEKTLYNWLTVIEMNYHAENTYHNSTHAADVLQAISGFLEKERLKCIMEPLDEAASIIAAAAHDVDHPGKSSAFLSNSDNPLALLYNDMTVLEAHHSALTFKLTLGDERVNIFKNLQRDVYKVLRQNIIDMILATEMTKHFEHLAKFVNVFCTKSPNDLETDTQTDYIPILLPENISLIRRMMIKCADVSNPTRPLGYCVEWARRIAEEYFQQTDEEKAKGLPVVMPMFDRTTCSIPKSQIGFVDFIVNDMFEAWNAFIDMPELMTYMRGNYVKWKEFDEQGISTLADIRKLQTTVFGKSKILKLKANDKVTD